MFTQTGRTLQKESIVGTRVQSRTNIACKGHSVMESENIRAGKDLGNCLAQLLHLGVEKTKVLIESVF